VGVTPVIPAPWEVEIGMVTVSGQPGPKVHNTPSLSIKAGVGGAHPARRIAVQASPGINLKKQYSAIKENHRDQPKQKS
jgi:hypothetical protein